MQDNFGSGIGGSGSARVGSGSDWESSRFSITAIKSMDIFSK